MIFANTNKFFIGFWEYEFEGNRSQSYCAIDCWAIDARIQTTSVYNTFLLGFFISFMLMGRDGLAIA